MTPAPLVVTLPAAMFLGEKMSPLRWALVAGRFVGAPPVAQPGNSTIGWPTPLPLTMVLTCTGFEILTSLFARTSASTLKPFVYAQIGFAMFCGWLVFDPLPGPLELLGIALMVASGLTASWLTARRGPPPTAPPA